MKEKKGTMKMNKSEQIAGEIIDSLMVINWFMIESRADTPKLKKMKIHATKASKKIGEIASQMQHKKED